MATVDYYHAVVATTEGFLGPAAERFIRRQIEFHIGKAPEKINRQDVEKLRESLRVALGLLVDDKQTVDDAVQKFDAITRK